jgi:hypothetical protein
MHFSGADPLCTHTLAGAASIVLTDLVEHRDPGATWEEKARQDNNLSSSQFFKIARSAQNFLKHARDDPAAVLDFNPSDTDALLTLAVFNSAELGPLSPEAEVFQLWSLALLCPDDMVTQPPFREAIAYFGRLQQMGRTEQLAAGLNGLRIKGTLSQKGQLHISQKQSEATPLVR